ncbi:tetratricopeptide repeat protein [Actinomadura luteofluorescens]|uniref:tetratricopeptide repeat protein n=1 Tax=Actinomadura luteofluorescens TaxID=46163 RepID=UPI0034963FAA
MHCAGGAGPAVHRTILCLDVEGYGRRTNGDQLAVRAGLYRALRRALDESGVPAASCYCEDRGDGAMILIRPDVPKELLAGRFPARLAALLERHNGGAPPDARIRVRVAVHAGEIHHDDHGVAGTAINTAFRLLAADPLKDALRTSPGVLALITSGWFFEEVVRQNPACRAAAFRPAQVAVKELRERAWMRPPDSWPRQDTARAAADERGIAYVLGGLGYASQNRWRYEESAELFTAACEVFSRLGDVRGEAWALHGLGYACRRLQRYREAVAHHRRSVLLTAAAGDRRSTGRALTALGYAYAGLADFGSSLDHFEQAHGIALDTDGRTLGWALHGLGYAHHGLRRLHTAIVHYERALDVFREFDDRPGQGEALYNLGRAHMQMSRPDAARDCWLRALAIFEDLRTPHTAGVLARLRSLDPRS